MLETVPGRYERRKRRKERRRGLTILVIFLIFVGGLTAGAGAFYAWATGASGPQNKVMVVIPHGATGSQVADLLKEKGIIRSSFFFRLILRFRHLTRGFQAGEYTLKTNMRVQAVLDALGKGPFVPSVLATFPEGLTIAQVARIAQDKLGVSAAAFVKAATGGKHSLPPYLPAGTKSVEGFLFPNTYEFLKGSDADAVITRLLGQFQVEARNLPWTAGGKLGVTDYQAVVLAAMVEREARFDEDRARIAEVIYNRIRKGMPLQIDATVEYAWGLLGKYKPQLTNADLKIDSPYNTYLHTGLPPAPIASPGLPSLLAALQPAQGDLLYFVVIDKAGHHAFTDNYQEFLRLKAKYSG